MRPDTVSYNGIFVVMNCLVAVVLCLVFMGCAVSKSGETSVAHRALLSNPNKAPKKEPLQKQIARKLFERFKSQEEVRGEFAPLINKENFFNQDEKAFLRNDNYLRFGVTEKLHGFEVFMVRELSESVFESEEETFTHDGLFGPIAPADAKSTDLNSDIEAMWEKTVKVKDGYLPSQEAMNAAIRVFNTVKLKGKTREEIYQLLGDPKTKNKTLYKRPFWEVEANAIYYIWENGNYGIQFNIPFDKRGHATKVVPKWIH